MHPRVHYVYLLRCADGTLYTGYTRDVRRREQAHNDGRGAKYTSGRRPVCLVYSEAFAVVGDALRREHELKRWSRARKEALIARQRVQPHARDEERERGRATSADATGQSRSAGASAAPSRS